MSSRFLKIIPDRLFAVDENGNETEATRQAPIFNCKHSFIAIKDGKCVGHAFSIADVARKTGLKSGTVRSAFNVGKNKFGGFNWINVRRLSKCKRCKKILNLEDRYLVTPKHSELKKQYSSLCKTCLVISRQEKKGIKNEKQN